MSQTSRCRVIFLNRYFFPDISATSQLLSDLAFELGDRGFDVHVVTSRLVYSSNRAGLPQFEKFGNVAIHRVWTSSFGRSGLGRIWDYVTFFVSAFVKCLTLADKRAVIISKTDPPIISVVGAIVARLRGSASINWLQDLFPEVAERINVKAPLGLIGMARAIRNWSLRVASMNVPIGERMSRVLVTEGIPASTMRLIPNWADGAAICPGDSATNLLRREWRLCGHFVVCYSGNMGRVHEFQTILSAARILKDDPNIAFLFIGGGKQRQKLEDIASACELRSVFFRDYVPRSMLQASLTLPDVHLVSLLPEVEGTVVPSKVYGIMAAGVPMINVASKDGEIAAMLEQGGVVGVTVEPGDVTGLVDKIRWLKENPTAAREMAAQARVIFAAKYERSVVLNLWIDLIEEVMATKVSSVSHEH